MAIKAPTMIVLQFEEHETGQRFAENFDGEFYKAKVVQIVRMSADPNADPIHGYIAGDVVDPESGERLCATCLVRASEHGGNGNASSIRQDIDEIVEPR